QAHAVDRDAFAKLRVGQRQAADGDAQARVAAARLARVEPADALHQSGEHQAAPAAASGRSSTRTSSPMRRVSTMRIFNRSVMASMCNPSNIGRAVSPSITGAT